MDSTLDRVKHILAHQLDRDEDDITSGTDLEDDLGADSLDVESLLMAIEEEIGCEIDARGLKTVGDIVKAIEM
jgi:acyl carrier protein